MKELLIYPESNQSEFDYESLLKNKKIETVTGIPVKIDKIFRDITGETVLAVGGTMSIRGAKVRGVWNLSGSIIEYKRIRDFLMPFKNWTLNFNGNEDMFQIVQVEHINNEQQ